MADNGHAAVAISLSQAHSSGDELSDHSPPPRTPKPSTKKRKNSHHHHHDRQPMMMVESSSTSENAASRKPRGRPPGSKNKPKPPVVITRESESAMRPVLLEISAGSDVIDSIVTFARRYNVGVSLISACGSVAQVTLRQPASQAHSLSLHGPFQILSLSGSFYGSASPPPFGLTLAGAQGQVFGGIVAGKMTAAGLVTVMAATFSNPSVQSLPIYSSDEGDVQVDETTKPSNHNNDNDNNNNNSGAIAESCSSAGKSMPVYAVANPTPLSCQMPPDHHVIHWAPPSRPSY